MSDDVCAWGHDGGDTLYGCLLTPEAELRREALRNVIETLKEISQSAMWSGENTMLEFVTNHGPQIVTYARCCPFEDIAVAFSELLVWIKRTCLLDVEDMLDDVDSVASSEGDTDTSGCWQQSQAVGGADALGGQDPSQQQPQQLPHSDSDPTDALVVPTSARRVKPPSSARRRMSPHWLHGEPAAPQAHPPQLSQDDACATPPAAAAGLPPPQLHPRSDTDSGGGRSPYTSPRQAPHGSAPPGGELPLTPPRDASGHPLPLHTNGTATRRHHHNPSLSRDFGTAAMRAGGGGGGGGSGDNTAPRPPRPKDWSERPCASFIPLECIEPLLTDNAKARALYEHAFLTDGEVSNFVRVLSIKPELGLIMLRGWHKTMSRGPLTRDCRWYIALCTATLCECEYWTARCEMNFFRAGGNPSWVAQGVHTAPAKLAGFASFNLKLVIHPWLLGKADVDTLVETCGWTLPELVQAIVISSQMQNFCGIVRGAGVLLDGTRATAAAAPAGPPAPATTTPDDVKPRRASSCSIPMVMHPSAAVDACTDMLQVIERTDDPFPEGTPLETFNKIVDGDMNDRDDDVFPVAASHTGTAVCRYTSISGNVDRVKFEGFRQRSVDKDAAYLRLSEFNWKDDASCVVDQLLSDELSQFLDENFQTVTTMTDNDIFGCIEGYDTSTLRRMVWYYILGVYGIVTDEHDYRGINKLVGIQQPGIIGLKRYMKYVGCLCGRITLSEYRFDGVYTQPFSHKDKLHITLLAAGARMQAALIYGMRVASKYVAGE